jgi:hypothetical protein
MADIFQTYPSHAAARGHSAALRAAGVPARRIQVLAAARQRDARLEPVGGFAGPVAPDAPIGTFANVSVTRRQGAGSFAGDAGRQRQGSFSDSDRPLVVSYEDGAERSRVLGQAELGALLQRAGVDDARVLHELRDGRAVVLAEVADVAAAAGRAHLHDAALAA